MSRKCEFLARSSRLLRGVACLSCSLVNTRRLPHIGLQPRARSWGIYSAPWTAWRGDPVNQTPLFVEVAHQPNKNLLQVIKISLAKLIPHIQDKDPKVRVAKSSLKLLHKTKASDMQLHQRLVLLSLSLISKTKTQS